MKIYLAAQYSQRDKLKEYKVAIEKLGHTVTSSWLNERKDPRIELNECSDRFLREHAQTDAWDIRNSDMIVLFTVSPLQPTKRGGRHVEFGIAYALDKQLVLCGPRENIFHYLPCVEQVDTFEALLEYLK